jgi:hypothetical protein
MSALDATSGGTSSRRNLWAFRPGHAASASGFIIAWPSPQMLHAVTLVAQPHNLLTECADLQIAAVLSTSAADLSITTQLCSMKSNPTPSIPEIFRSGYGTGSPKGQNVHGWDFTSSLQPHTDANSSLLMEHS